MRTNKKGHRRGLFTSQPFRGKIVVREDGNKELQLIAGELMEIPFDLHDGLIEGDIVQIQRTKRGDPNWNVMKVCQ